MGRTVRKASRLRRPSRRKTGLRSLGAAQALDPRGPAKNIPKAISENQIQEALFKYLYMIPLHAATASQLSFQKFGEVSTKSEGDFVVYDPRGMSLGDIAYAIPNGVQLAGGKASRARYMAALKRRGLNPGVPDVCIPLPTNDYPGLYIELKTKLGVLSDAQAEKVHLYRWLGYRVEICFSLDSAISVVLKYIKGT